MQPEMKVPLGVAEAEDLAVWLEGVAALYDARANISEQEARITAAEAREWARVVKPVPINDKKR